MPNNYTPFQGNPYMNKIDENQFNNWRGQYYGNNDYGYRPQQNRLSDLVQPQSFQYTNANFTQPQQYQPQYQAPQYQAPQYQVPQYQTEQGYSREYLPSSQYAAASLYKDNPGMQNFYQESMRRNLSALGLLEDTQITRTKYGIGR